MKELNSKANKLISIAYALIAVITICAIYVFAPVCSNLLELANGNMVHMKCYYTAQAATYLAILLLVCSFINLYSKKNISLITIVIGVMLITITISEIGSLPVGIGVCKKSTMACIKTAIWLKGCGALTIILSIVQIILNSKTKKAKLTI